MKHIIYLIFLSLLCFGCEESIIGNEEYLHTKGNNYINEIRSFIHLTHNIDNKTREGMDEFSIVPYVQNEDTTLYIVNYNTGWQIFANCKFAPLILAESEHGFLDIEKEMYYRLYSTARTCTFAYL